MKFSNFILAISFAVASFLLNTCSLVAQEVSKDNDITGVWYRTYRNEPLFLTKKSKDTLRVTFLSSQYIDIPRDTLNTASYRYTKINPNARSPRGRVRNYRIRPIGKDSLELYIGDVIFFAQRKHCKE